MGFKLTGPAGSVELERGLMVPRRHIHLNEHEVEAAGFGDKDFVNVRVEGPRAMVMENVLVRIGKGGTVMHVDYDEMNAAGLTSPAEGWAYKE